MARVAVSRRCSHDWVRMRPVVVVINDPERVAKGGVTCNARCARCGHVAWAHWPGGAGSPIEAAGDPWRTVVAR
jgi:hypothetical protein